MGTFPLPLRSAVEGKARLRVPLSIRRMGRGAGFGEGGLGGGEAGDGDAEGRAGDIVQPDLGAEADRGGIAAMLAADAELELGARAPAALGGDLHQLAHPV